MEHQFWHEKWEENQIPFHRGDVNPVLTNNWRALEAPAGGKVLLPLCGKTRDLAWLTAQGHQALGGELSEIAVRAFFEENGLVATREQADPFVRYRAAQVEYLCGDFFALQPEHLGGVVAVYDRAALIALPPPLRAQYAAKMRTLLQPGVEVLLVTISYRDGQINAPPFRVLHAEVEALYAPWCAVELLEESADDVKGQLCPQFAYRLQVR